VRPGRGFFPPFDLVKGFVGFFRAALLLFARPEFRGLLWVPFTLNVILSAAMFYAVFSLGSGVFLSITSGSWGFMDFLRSAVSFAAPVFAFLLAALVLFFLLPGLQQLVLAPFLDPIARRMERILIGTDPPGSGLGLLREAHASVAFSLRVLVLQFCSLVVAILLAGLGIGLIGGVLVAAYFAALVWFDHPLARRGLTFGQKNRFLLKNLPLALGFGLGYQVALLVPVFNFLLSAPAAAAGASMLYFGCEKRVEKGRARS
jgi:CysZ protein